MAVRVSTVMSGLPSVMTSVLQAVQRPGEMMKGYKLSNHTHHTYDVIARNTVLQCLIQEMSVFCDFCSV